MIRQPGREQLNRLVVKTLDQVFIVTRYYTAETLAGQPSVRRPAQEAKAGGDSDPPLRF